jgi:Mrp family chromosome partitioning ATPase/uncharacterized protein involved in exopolysaccharide biosynthesis
VYPDYSNWAHELRQVFAAFGRRRRAALVTFLVVAAALAMVFLFFTPSNAVCLMAVKKPSEIFVPIGEEGIAASASVPLLEGQTYKIVVATYGFAAQVAKALTKKGVAMEVTRVHRSVAADFRDPDLLRLTGSDKDPQRAILLANAACETLSKNNQEELRAQLQEQEAAISQLLATAHEEVQKNLVALATYAQQHGVLNIDFDAGSSDLEHSLQTLGTQQVNMAQQQAELEQDLRNLEVLKTPDGAHVNALSFPVQDPVITSIQTQIEQARKDLWDAQKVYTPDHPAVKNLTFELNALSAELARRVDALKGQKTFHPSPEWKVAIAQAAAETESRIVGERGEIAAWNDLISQQRQVLGVVPEEAGEINKLKVALSFSQDRYQQLAKQLDSTRVSLNSAAGTLSIIQLAAGAELPNWVLRTIVCLGLLIGMPIGVALFVDYLGDSVNSPVGFARDLGEICLAAVPKSRYLTPRHLRQRNDLPALNEFRVMRSSLQLVWGQQAPRVIGIISGHAREGRSTVTLQLARALVEERRRATILDADLRTVGMAAKLGLAPKAGLLGILTGETTLDEALVPISDEVQLLPAKAQDELVPANADLLFQGPRFRECLEQLKQRNDVVLIDMPPLLEFPDAAEMLRDLEALVLVVNGENRARATETARACLDLLRHVEAKRLGIVINQILS